MGEKKDGGRSETVALSLAERHLHTVYSIEHHNGYVYTKGGYILNAISKLI